MPSERKWLSFEELMGRDDVVTLADQMFSDETKPGHQELFTALTTAVLTALPEDDVGPGTAMVGACVFYVADAGDSDAYRPWTLEVGLGASSWYTFTALDRSEQYTESDSEPWQLATLAMLARSLWRPVQPAGLP